MVKSRQLWRRVASRLSHLRRLLPTSNARPSDDIAALDGLRGLAIVLVVACHSDLFSAMYGTQAPALVNLLAGYAYSGVVLFFVLSGFLLFLPYARSLVAGRGWPRVRTFYVRRVLRILPLYYAVLLAIMLGSLRAHGWGGVAGFGMSQLVLSATLLYGLGSGAYGFVTGTNAPLWSLTIEWQFYLVLPWIALLIALLAGARYNRREQPGAARALHPWRVSLAIVGLIIFGLATRALGAVAFYVWGYTVPIDAGGPRGAMLAVFYGMDGKYLEVFALGMLGSVLYVLVVERQHISPRARRRLGLGMAALGLLGLDAILPWAIGVQRLFLWTGWVGFFPPPSGWAWNVFGDASLGVAFAAIVLAALFHPGVARLFSFGPLRFLGTISYSMYVWHNLLFLYVFPHHVSEWPAVLWSVVAGPSVMPATIAAPGWPRMVLLWLAIVLVSVASYYIIERPFLRLRYRVPARSRSAAAASATSAGVALSASSE